LDFNLIWINPVVLGLGVGVGLGLLDIASRISGFVGLFGFSDFSDFSDFKWGFFDFEFWFDI